MATELFRDPEFIVEAVTLSEVIVQVPISEQERTEWVGRPSGFNGQDSTAARDCNYARCSISTPRKSSVLKTPISLEFISST